MNVIVLTTGLSGSSLVTGLLAISGFWAGDETVYKNNTSGTYQTYENSTLVELNDLLLKEAGLSFNYRLWYENQPERFEVLKDLTNIEPCKQFIKTCDENSPWLWKDPKLWLTIGFWEKYLTDKSSVRILIVQRDTFHLWVSQTCKRIIYDFGYLQRQEKQSLENLTNWLADKKFSYKQINYESLLQSPETEICKLGKFLGVTIDLDTFHAIYTPVNRFRGLTRSLLAVGIYLKNYPDRIR